MIELYRQKMEEALELARRYERCPEDKQKAAGAKEAREEAEFYRNLMEEAIAEENNNTEKENENMNTNIDLTNNTATFESNGILYTYHIDTKRYSKTVNGKTTRIGKAEYILAEENHRQNEQNKFVNITEEELETLVAETEESNTDEATAEIAKEMEQFDEMAEDTQVSLEEFVEKVAEAEGKRKAKKTRKNKDAAFRTWLDENGNMVGEGNGTMIELTAKQVDFIRHLPDTCFWENGLDSTPWTDVLCDEIGGQFAGKPMTSGAMISTLCEKGLAYRGKDRINNRKCTYMGLTEWGKVVAKELGLN